MSIKTEAYILDRVHQLSGKPLGWVAQRLQVRPPVSLHREKGWIGQLVERWLGVTASTLAGPDFPELQLEVKTIPVNRSGQPMETTFVSTAPLIFPPFSCWRESVVWQKLQRVLWIPIDCDRTVPVCARRILKPFLWSPSAVQAQALQTDWEELVEQITVGEVESLTGHQGQYLQLRPKAANKRVTTQAIGREGVEILTYPRAFYLRTRFTQAILRERLHWPPRALSADQSG